MLYNVSFDICAAVLLVPTILLMLFRRDLGRLSNKVFLLVLVMHLFAALSDIASSVFNSYVETYGFLIRDVANYLFLGVHTSEAAVFFFFLLVQLGVYQRMRPWQQVLAWLPEALMVLLPLALNPFFQCVFFYDEAKIYVHGPWMAALYAGADLYMLLCIIFVALKRASMTRQQRIAALLLLLLSLVPMLVQSILMPQQLIEIFFQSIGLYGYLVAVENMDDLHHPITNMWNRNALLKHIAHQEAGNERAGLVIIKTSQIEAFRVASEGTALLQGLKLSLADWFQQVARQEKMRAYDCDMGVFAFLTVGNTAESRCSELCQLADARFADPWKYRGAQAVIPIQITYCGPDDFPDTTEELLHLVSHPYFHETEGVTYAKREELAETPVPDHKQQLPEDLQELLDRFLAGLSELTPAERNICDLYVRGHEICEIPEIAFISINTVKKHNKNIYRKLGVNSREDLLLHVNLFYLCGKEELLDLRF